MNPQLEFKAWDTKRKEWKSRLNVYVNGCGEKIWQFGNDFDIYPEVEIVRSTGHSSIDGKKVFDGDYLRFPGQQEIYEVKWDQQEGAWTIAYKGMTAFKIGMAWFMELAGNRFEGIKEDKETNHATQTHNR